MTYYKFSEAETRYNLIDPAIKKAGWNLSDRTQIWFEVPVQGYDASPQSGITDYCLYRTNGEVLAVIEAKKKARCKSWEGEGISICNRDAIDSDYYLKLSGLFGSLMQRYFG